MHGLTLNKAVSTGLDKIKGFVIDLRDNPGGLLDEAVPISEYGFLDKGEIVSTRAVMPRRPSASTPGRAI